MREADFVPFCGLLCDTLGIWGEAPSAALQVIWFRALSQHPFAIIEQAFSAHLRDPQNGKFAPKPAHIVAQIEQAVANDGRPEANEAWALALQSTDETDTVVWTVEAAEAMSAARPILDLGDKVGARMAFIEAYTKLVREARQSRVPTQWQVSEGFDRDRRRVAVAQAIELGRIPAGKDYLALMAPAQSPLLGGSVPMPEGVREKIKALRDSFAHKYEAEPSLDAMGKDATARAKNAAAEMVQAYMKRGKA